MVFFAWIIHTLKKNHGGEVLINPPTAADITQLESTQTAQLSEQVFIFS